MERAQLPRAARDVPQGRLHDPQAARAIRHRPEVARRESLILQRVSFVVGGLRRKGELVGTLHLPDLPSIGAALALHGFGGDPEQPHIVETCAALAAAGVAALRFPYRDHEPPRMTLRSAVEDVKAAFRLLQAHPQVNADRLAIIGFSFGGAVAAVAAGREHRVRAAILAAAPSDFRGEKPRPLDEIRRTKARVLLLWGSRDDQVPAAHAERYAAVLREAGTTYRYGTIDGGDHDFGPAEARARMTAAVAEWVRGSL